MLSFIWEEAPEKIDRFMRALKFPPLCSHSGRPHTTLSYPVLSSHADVPDGTPPQNGHHPPHYPGIRALGPR